MPVPADPRDWAQPQPADETLADLASDNRKTRSALLQPRLTVVIPAYNEAPNIRRGALEKVARYLEGQPYPYEILVVDDGSDDDTAAQAEGAARHCSKLRVIRNPHRGKAYAVATGLLAAAGEIVLFTDMDLATPIEETERLLPWFDQGYDVVIGSRGTVRRHAPLWRRLMSRAQILLRNWILGFRDVTDTQCGFKAFRREVARDLVCQLQLYRPDSTHRARGPTVTSGFDVEMLFVAKKLGYRITEVPVEWDYQRTRRVNLLRDSVRGLLDLVRIRAADLRGSYTPARNRTGAQREPSTQ